MSAKGFARLIGAMILAAASMVRADEAPRDGDIIFHTSRSAQSLAIQRATHSPYSHVGVIVLRNGKPFVFEAIATVRYTPLAQWIARGDRGRYVIKRLKTPMTAQQARKLRAAAGRYEGRAYDLYFEWSDDRIYCSELVWKMYRDALGLEIGTRQKLRDFDLADPVVKAKMRERYGTNVPLDEPVISPGAQFESPLLVTVRAK
ncbi:MAG TPA: YiiX family permuted papain-like enzyme [Steroidobacteraceae bacterium]|nr:YiiX family permuted papain-like enzyme [Steroidobacteraceae bacterium]